MSIDFSPATDPAALTGGQLPSLGRMVWFTSRGSADGEFLPEQRMAWITEVSPLDGHVSLFVVTPNGVFHDQDVPYADTSKPGSWTWPTYR